VGVCVAKRYKLNVTIDAALGSTDVTQTQKRTNKRVRVLFLVILRFRAAEKHSAPFFDGAHFAPAIGHGLEGMDPDGPDKHAGAYFDYATALYSLASHVYGNSRASAQDLATTVKYSSDKSQKRLLSGIAQWSGSADSAGMVNTPVARM
jgi:hypothetical protein